jgi:SOS response regulatory protein OraA/RecX
VAELRRLGVAASIIQEVLGPPEADAGEEAARAAALLVRMGDPTPPLEATRRRALDRLRRRGFSNAVAYRAVQDWLAAAATQYDHDNGDRAGDS